MSAARRIREIVMKAVIAIKTGQNNIRAESLRTSDLPGVEPQFTAWFIAQVVISFAMVIITLPAQAVIGAIVAITSSFPIFYQGPRVGRGAQVFKLIKFRTLPDKYEYQVGGRLLTDKERTRGLFAKLIVRLKMDELPQLYNVLRGEMALVGPRPVRPALYARYRSEIDGYGAKFAVRPGITGLAQIIGGYYMDPALKHHYDLIYIKNKSVALDIKIIILTAAALFLSRRIMKTRIVEKFLGIDLNIQADHVDTTAEIMQKVTSGNDIQITELDGSELTLGGEALAREA